MRVSVVIPAFNESKNIAKTLQALANQEGQTQFEVIVVDNNSTDDTALIAHTFVSRLELRIISESTPGRGAARAAGFKAAAGGLILSTDGDTIVPVNWVDVLSSALSNHASDAVTGTCCIVDCSPFTNSVFNRFQPFVMRLYRVASGHYWLTGSNFGIKKAVYEQAGGFNPKVPDLEDIDLGQRLHPWAKIKFINDSPVITSGERFHNSLFAGLLGYIQAYIRRFWFNRPENFRDTDQKK